MVVTLATMGVARVSSQGKRISLMGLLQRGIIYSGILCVHNIHVHIITDRGYSNVAHHG